MIGSEFEDVQIEYPSIILGEAIPGVSHSWCDVVTRIISYESEKLKSSTEQ